METSASDERLGHVVHFRVELRVLNKITSVTSFLANIYFWRGVHYALRLGWRETLPISLSTQPRLLVFPR
ncbi:hypothetical protein Y032_0003g1463 [Ancylostoma ceylanicum]|uniref:Uncharacterized protein n=1 Tax=Ancylostoma ceylanicum TaxID=53326 RepID=A0A016VY17_9BILA|nr:hypothetical protein Y032_0003g1463 [Ancylostoma ceylanicum]